LPLLLATKQDSNLPTDLLSANCWSAYTGTACIRVDEDQWKDSMSSNPTDGLGLDSNVVAFQYGVGEGEVAVTDVPTAVAY
jgi:hypothetical protein